MSRSPAGWYVEKTDFRTERWWDGSTWTGATRPVSAPTPDGHGRNSGLFEVPQAPGFEVPQPPGEVGLEGILTGPAFGAAPHLTISTVPHSSDLRQELVSHRTSAMMALKIAAFVMVLTMVGSGTFLFMGLNPSADASVALALNSTLGNRTADMTVSGSVGVGSAKVDLAGSGTVNFTQNAAQLQLTTSIHGNQVTEGEVTIGDTIYLELGPLMGRLVPGKTWVSMNLSQLNQGGSASPLGIGGGLSTNNPAAILKDLSQPGNTVTALGPSMINGTSVQGYSVQVNQAAVRDALADAHLPRWLQQGVAVSGNLNVSYDVYIDGTGLLYRMTVEASVPVDGQNLNGVVSMDFTNYGTSTPTITAPPAGAVAPYGTFIQKF